jgi:dihydroxyacetone kinase-like protein
MHHALERICEVVEEQKTYLSELDGAIGDGDHGVNMAKCFREVKKKLGTNQGKDLQSILKDVGMVVLNSVGGAMGALYGTFFLKLAQEAAGKSELRLGDLVRMLQVAEKGVLEIGKAKPGDKTLIDTLSPAVRSLEQAEKESKSLAEALADFQEAARKGMESTKDMVAKMGRASRLGERTVGHQDAGATSCYLNLQALTKGLTQL